MLLASSHGVEGDAAKHAVSSGSSETKVEAVVGAAGAPDSTKSVAQPAASPSSVSSDDGEHQQSTAAAPVVGLAESFQLPAAHRRTPYPRPRYVVQARNESSAPPTPPHGQSAADWYEPWATGCDTPIVVLDPLRAGDDDPQGIALYVPAV